MTKKRPSFPLLGLGLAMGALRALASDAGWQPKEQPKNVAQMCGKNVLS